MPHAIGFAALFPLVVGPTPSEQNELIAELCGGGTISLPINGQDQEPAPSCHIKGCHACDNRKKGELLPGKGGKK